jgi:anti-sigma regulatory factor (Ser/Thr protein kinase)
MIIHSHGGVMWVEISPDAIMLFCNDTGPGITDIDMAMREGYSTASSDVRMMGFGAGMGLPNMKKNSDEFSIRSDTNGTCLNMRFNIN